MFTQSANFNTSIKEWVERVTVGWGQNYIEYTIPASLYCNTVSKTTYSKSLLQHEYCNAFQYYW